MEQWISWQLHIGDRIACARNQIIDASVTAIVYMCRIHNVLQNINHHQVNILQFSFLFNSVLRTQFSMIAERCSAIGQIYATNAPCQTACNGEIYCPPATGACICPPGLIVNHFSEQYSKEDSNGQLVNYEVPMIRCVESCWKIKCSHLVCYERQFYCYQFYLLLSYCGILAKEQIGERTLSRSQDQSLCCGAPYAHFSRSLIPSYKNTISISLSVRNAFTL